jgi:hypothetical protein
MLMIELPSYLYIIFQYVILEIVWFMKFDIVLTGLGSLGSLWHVFNNNKWLVPKVEDLDMKRWIWLQVCVLC